MEGWWPPGARGRPRQITARSYGAVRSPEVAEITGAGREWTVSMISALSIPLQVDAGDPQIAMAELALDRYQRHALVCELDSVRMPQLMRREPPADARRFRRPTKLFASRGGLPAPPSGRAVNYAEQRPDRQGLRTSRYGVN